MIAAVSMNLDLQIEIDWPGMPGEADFNYWTKAALEHLEQSRIDTTNLCIRVVDEKEITELNQNYRHKEGSTNVLSFPAHLPDFIVLETKEKALGDIILCAPVIAQEASEQGKETIAHWAHLTVHGVLHLLDYDHESTEEADKMESIEIAILQQLGFPNPY